MAKPISDETKREIVALYESGYKRIDIEAATGVSQPTIRNILEDAGYPRNKQRRPRPIGRKTIAKIIEMRNAGLSYNVIADQLDIPKRSVYTIVAEHVEKISGHGESVSAEEFVKAWQTSTSAKEVAQKLGMTVSMVTARSNSYRGKGVPLKQFSRSNSIDWDGLAEFADLLADDD